MLPGFHRLADGFLHGIFLPLVYIAQVLGGAESEFGAHHLQLFHLSVDVLLVVLCFHFLLSVYLFEDVCHVSCHVYWGGDGIDDSPVAVLFHAQGLGVFFLKGIGKSAEESLSGFQYFYGRLLCFVGLGCLGVDEDRILARIQTLYLIVQIIFGWFPSHGIG